MRPFPMLLCAALAFAPGAFARVEPVDNCATVLGSLSIELRFARELPPGRKTSYSCAKRYASLVGARRERILRSLGTPDRSSEEGGWSYVFASKYAAVPEGSPELVFRFGGDGVVESVDCHRSAP